MVWIELINGMLPNQRVFTFRTKYEYDSYGRLREVETPAVRYFYHKDHLGGSLLATSSAGTVILQVPYLPFGEVFLEKRSGDWCSPYLFNGKELDEETGLYYYGARYYDPALEGLSTAAISFFVDGTGTAKTMPIKVLGNMP